jgi:GWxTD domain-containing protein
MTLGQSLRGRGAHRCLYVLLAFAFLAGLAVCGGADRVRLDPESKSFYQYARLIMTGEEKDIFNHLPDAATRQEFIQDFWAKRDPDPGTKANEFKDEFYRRIDYANRRFKEGTPGWKTDRGWVYIHVGEPDKTEEFHDNENPEVRGSTIWWVYYRYELGIEFVDERNNGTYRMRNYDGDFLEAMDSLKLGAIPYTRGEKRRFANFKLSYEADSREITVRLPSEAIDFQDDKGGFRADLDFQVFVYRKGGPKLDEFKLEKSYQGTIEQTEKLKEISFVFPYSLAAGDYYLDVLITGRNGSLGKTRKIFEVKV